MSILVLEHSPSTGALHLGATLRDYGHRLRTIALHEGDPLPPDLDDVDGVVTTGGPQSALKEHSWLEPEMDLLRRADAAALPVIGVCLGSQILARALGGELGPTEGGVELGWHEVSLTPVGAEDVLYAGIAWRSPQFHWHREQVAKTPPGARVLASSKRCPVQAWGRGLRTCAFQYHPEIDPETIERWVSQDPKALQEAGTSLEQLRHDTQRYYPEYERLRQRLFQSIALCLLPADQRAEGLVKDLHH